MIGSILQSLRYDEMFIGLFWEFFNISLWACMLIYSLKTRGGWDTLKIFLIGMIYGLVLENGGPMQIPELGFYGYFWEDMYQIYLFEFFGFGIRISSVPLATHLGWSNVFLVCLLFWEAIAKAFPKIRKKIVLGGIIMALSGWLLDLNLDPLATRFKWWVWNDNLLPVWFGVPLMNYVAWFWAVGVFGAVWVWIHEILVPGRTNEDKKKQIKLLILALFPMWITDTVYVMTCRFIMELAGIMYITPYPIVWQIWYLLPIAGFTSIPLYVVYVKWLKKRIPWPKWLLPAVEVINERK
jgi:uncharacterized membrane protein